MKKVKMQFTEEAKEDINSLPLSSLYYINGYISALVQTTSRELENEMFGKKTVEGCNEQPRV